MEIGLWVCNALSGLAKRKGATRCPRRRGRARRPLHPQKSANRLKATPTGQLSSRRRSIAIFHDCILFPRTRKITEHKAYRLTMTRRECWKWWSTRGRTSSSLEPQVRSSSSDAPHLHFPSFLSLIERICRQGTGKSLLLRAIIAALRKKHVKNLAVVSVTASTGMAASNIGGSFLSSI